MQKFDLFIGGKWVEPRSKDYLPDFNPWTGELLAEVAVATFEDVNDAVLSAVQAQKVWQNFLPSAKEKVLLSAASILEQNFDSYVEFLCAESGSAVPKAQYEVGVVVDILRAAAGECRRVFGQIFPAETDGMVSMAVRQPRGVITAIGPFNFPFLLLTKKTAFAVAAGNGVVAKSSSETPGIAYKIATLFTEAGVPAGLVNAISGLGSQIGDALTTHPRVAMISFTGSTEVGRHINRTASETFKKVSLEMGGKSALIVLKDADVDYAVNAAAFGIFMHQGQICMVNSRIIVERPVYEEFLAKFSAKAKMLPIGSEKNQMCVIGPLITNQQLEKVHSHVTDAIAKGAKVVAGGTHQGLFYQPTVLADVNPSMKVFAEETFGPVAVVIPVESVDEAVEIANATCYGLSAAVITQDVSLAFKVAEELESGAVHINDSTVYDEPMVPFGGVKESGMGREGGHFSIEEYTELKWITIKTKKTPFPF
ncbi:MAG: hypothetical protein APF81_05310 [Desulfosporosinus sp. BRH_c37]|nr:MAG: hypothetical protein APF81_05310 [Desulfosporosinus sp. BRH_c37]